MLIERSPTFRTGQQKMKIVLIIYIVRKSDCKNLAISPREGKGVLEADGSIQYHSIL